MIVFVGIHALEEAVHPSASQDRERCRSNAGAPFPYPRGLPPPQVSLEQCEGHTDLFVCDSTCPELLPSEQVNERTPALARSLSCRSPVSGDARRGKGALCLVARHHVPRGSDRDMLPFGQPSTSRFSRSCHGMSSRNTSVSFGSGVSSFGPLARAALVALDTTPRGCWGPWT